MRFAFFTSLLMLFVSAAMAQSNTASLEGEDSRWGLSYFNLGSASQQAVQDGSASWNIYQYFSINYKISKEERLHIRPAFSITTPGFDDRGRTVQPGFRDNDFHFAYSHYSLLAEDSDYNLVGRFYLHLPTTDSSRSKKWITRLKAWMTLERYMGSGFVVAYNFKPDYFVHTQKAYTVESNNGLRTDNNQIGALDHYIQFGYKVNQWFTPQIDIGAVHEWYHTSEEADSRPALVESYKIAPNTWINLNKSLKFIVGWESKYDARLANFSNPTESGFYIMTFATFL